MPQPVRFFQRLNNRAVEADQNLEKSDRPEDALGRNVMYLYFRHEGLQEPGELLHARVFAGSVRDEDHSLPAAGVNGIASVFAGIPFLDIDGDFGIAFFRDVHAAASRDFGHGEVGIADDAHAAQLQLRMVRGLPFGAGPPAIREVRFDHAKANA